MGLLRSGFRRLERIIEERRIGRHGVFRPPRYAVHDEQRGRHKIHGYNSVSETLCSRTRNRHRQTGRQKDRRTESAARTHASGMSCGASPSRIQYMYTRTHIYIYIYIYILIYIYRDMYLFIYIDICIYISICIYIFIYVYTHASAYVGQYSHTCICIHK